MNQVPGSTSSAVTVRPSLAPRVSRLTTAPTLQFRMKAQAVMGTWRRALATWWEDFDLLLTPTTAAPPPPLGELTPSDEDPVRGSKGSVPYSVYTSPFNTSGQPAISLPLGSSDGLPVGVQLVASYGREDLLIAVGAQLAAEVRWSEQRAPIHA